MTMCRSFHSVTRREADRVSTDSKRDATRGLSRGRFCVSFWHVFHTSLQEFLCLCVCVCVSSREIVCNKVYKRYKTSSSVYTRYTTSVWIQMDFPLKEDVRKRNEQRKLSAVLTPALRASCRSDRTVQCRDSPDSHTHCNRIDLIRICWKILHPETTGGI